MARQKKTRDPFHWFGSSPEVIGLVVMMYVRYPLWLRNLEDLLFERGIDICHETVRLWWNRFGPMFAAEIRKRRVAGMRAHTHWRWRLDEVYVKINGEMRDLWRAVDHEGEVLESFVATTRAEGDGLKPGRGRGIAPNWRVVAVRLTPPWTSMNTQNHHFGACRVRQRTEISTPPPHPGLRPPPPSGSVGARPG